MRFALLHFEMGIGILTRALLRSGLTSPGARCSAIGWSRPPSLIAPASRC